MPNRGFQPFSWMVNQIDLILDPMTSSSMGSPSGKGGGGKLVPDTMGLTAIFVKIGVAHPTAALGLLQTQQFFRHTLSGTTLFLWVLLLSWVLRPLVLCTSQEWSIFGRLCVCVCVCECECEWECECICYLCVLYACVYVSGVCLCVCVSVCVCVWSRDI